MKTYIFIIIFGIGLVTTIYDRYHFETKKKSKKDADYRNLFRENNNLFIIIFLTLLVINVIKLFN